MKELQKAYDLLIEENNLLRSRLKAKDEEKAELSNPVVFELGKEKAHEEFNQILNEVNEVLMKEGLISWVIPTIRKELREIKRRKEE